MGLVEETAYTYVCMTVIDDEGGANKLVSLVASPR
jgi:hypothetical protein